MPCKGDLNVLTDTYNTIFIMFEQENKGLSGNGSHKRGRSDLK